ncbi:hypothetical protein BC829DRAFT_439687 [Chytridium lagenaria]|nr:hypothetical protein BC829DRAFT_439687 [Chytridium lagenaria]
MEASYPAKTAIMRRHIERIVITKKESVGNLANIVPPLQESVPVLSEVVLLSKLVVLLSKFRCRHNSGDSNRLHHLQPPQHHLAYKGDLKILTAVALSLNRLPLSLVWTRARILPAWSTFNYLVIGGWDCANLADAMTKAKVLSTISKDSEMKVKPLPSICYPDYIATNHEDRADNSMPGPAIMDHV